jgi:hypothetical protein
LLHNRLPQLYSIHFGLAEIARQQNDTDTAVAFYQLYLQHAPTDSEEAKLVAQRLEQLQP